MKNYNRNNTFWQGLIGVCLGVWISTTPILGQPDTLSLKTNIEAIIQPYHNQVGLSFLDLNTFTGFDINGNAPVNPASTIKVAIAAAVYAQIETGTLTPSQWIYLKKRHIVPGAGSLQYQQLGSRYTIQELIDQMLTHSDNTATKMLADTIGLSVLNETFTQWGLTSTQLVDTNLIKGKQNQTTPNDMAYLLTRLETQKLISARYSKRILNLLSHQDYRWGIPKYLPASADIANKTGTLKNIRNDIGIVTDGGTHYVLTIYTNQLYPDSEAKNVIAAVSKLIYLTLSQTDPSIKPSEILVQTN